VSKILTNSTGTKSVAANESPKVCVITRTKNRSILLRRAADSVRSQTFQDFRWVVVNDGGNREDVELVIKGSGINREKVNLISNSVSMGMEAASNVGVRSMDSEYIVIHDDDDSWDPEFLSKTISFMTAPEGQRYGGVVTYTNYVSELIRDNEVIRLSEKPYQGKITGVDLDAVIDRNLYPPISFLFRRDIYNMIGGFDETLPVLGDWLFNMEFLLRANIGVIPEFLALYHHRDRSELTPLEYKNTVVDQVSTHEEYTSIVRNIFLRRNLNQSAISLRLSLPDSGGSTRAGIVSGERAAATHLPSIQYLSRGEGDLSWAIGAINAALADRRPKQLFKYRKVRPLPPNATWSLALPALRKLKIALPTPADFDEGAYLRANPDVAAEVRKGAQKSGFTHYILHGRHEGRARTSGEYIPQVEQLEHVIGGERALSRVRPVLNSPLMLRTSQRAAGFEKVLHVAHHEWHGIRQAVAYSPGNKLLVPSEEPINDSDKREIAETISRLGIDRVCIHGYSENTDGLLLYLRSALSPNVKFYMVSHVTTAQFDHRFEMTVISKILNRLKFGILDGIASVKPNFGQAIEGFWSGTIINYAPNIPIPYNRRSDNVEVYAPLDVGWRKNLFTNIMAASLAKNVDIVKTANFPNGLEDIHDIRKLRLVGYLRGRDLLDEMARSSLTLIATLAECQPMTQLESFAVGTPAMTGPLGLAEFADDPLTDLCTTHVLDNPALLARDIEKVVGVLRSDPIGVEQMIVAHLARRHKIATQNYADFLEL